MEFRVLGPLEVLDDGGEPLPLGGPRPRALLALLLLNANEVVSVERLIDGVWDDDPPATAQSALQVHVHALRKLLGPDRIVTRAPGYLLRVEAGELDADVFERLVAQGRAEALREALGLWRGPALADVAVRPFARVDAARLEESRLAALESRVDADLAGGRHAGLVAELEALVTEHPHREGLQARLMLALYRSGRQADALAAYRRARGALDELGLEPSAGLRALEQRILRQDPDLDLPTDAVPPTSPPADRLIGRDLERATLQALLEGRTHPVVTVTGTAGVGKTSLARSAGGVSTLVELAGIEDAALVPVELARALGCAEDPTRPIAEVVAEALGMHGGIVVLDNFEHVLEARETLGWIVEQAPQARLLVTSRVPLRIAGEREYRLAPLETPAVGVDGLDDVAGVPAVELYVERAGDAVPGFALTAGNAAAIARIARLLDGLPLAIELAAARVRALGPEATASRLGDGIALLRRAAPDRPERQRSVSAAIDWSYRLLDPEQQRWFRALGVLAGGGSLELVEALRDGADAADALDALVDASLLIHRADEDGTPRFSMLQPIREHALELLAAHDEEHAVRDGHLSHLLAAAEEADAVRRRDLAAYPRAQLRLETDNVRAALDHASRSGEHEVLARLTCAQAIFWTLEEAYAEGRDRFEVAYAALDDVTPAALRFGVVNGLALFSYYNGDLTRALELNEQALSAGEQLVDPGDAGRALRLRSSIANTLGQPSEAQAALARAIPLLERAGDAASAGRSLFTLADAHRRAGDIPAAVEEGTRAAEALASIGDREGAGFAWLVVAAAHVTGGAHEAAVDALGRGLELAESAGDVGSVDTATLLRARVAADRGELRLAAILLGYARSAWERLGASRWEIEREYWEPIEIALATGLTADERSELAAQGARMQANVAASLVREPLAPEPIGRA